MKKILLFLPLLAATMVANAQQVQVLDGFDSPESVLLHKQAVYVSNVGKQLQPAEKDGDGFISLLSPEGKVLGKHFLPLPDDTLHAPKGMALSGNTLYVSDIDRIVGFDLHTRRKTFDLSLRSVSAFLNDLELLDRQHLVVSATDAGKLYVIDLSGKGSFTELRLPLKISGANGLKYDPHRQQLYVNGFGENGQPNGELYAIKMGADPMVEKLTKAQGYYDGLAIDKENLLLSSWESFEKEGVIVSVNLQNGSTDMIPLPVRFAGPADICFNRKKRVLWVPAIMEGKVYRIAMGR